MRRHFQCERPLAPEMVFQLFPFNIYREKLQTIKLRRKPAIEHKKEASDRLYRMVTPFPVCGNGTTSHR
jgi:hypothetical protein